MPEKTIGLVPRIGFQREKGKLSCQEQPHFITVQLLAISKRNYDCGRVNDLSGRAKQNRERSDRVAFDSVKVSHCDSNQ